MTTRDTARSRWRSPARWIALLALIAGLIAVALMGDGRLSVDQGASVVLIAGTIGGLAASARWIGMGFSRREGPNPDGAREALIRARWRNVSADLGTVLLFGLLGVIAVTIFVMAAGAQPELTDALLPAAVMQLLWTLTYLGGLFLPGLVWIPVAIAVRGVRLRRSGTRLSRLWWALFALILLIDATIASSVATILLVPSVSGANTSRHWIPAAGVDLGTLDPGLAALVMVTNVLWLAWAVLVLALIISARGHLWRKKRRAPRGEAADTER